MGLPVLRKGLSGQGIAHAWLLGSVVFGVFGAGSYALMCLYFVTGTLVSCNRHCSQGLFKINQQAHAYRRHAQRIDACTCHARSMPCMLQVLPSHGLWGVVFLRQPITMHVL
jgi:uncharacterized membrane protein